RCVRDGVIGCGFGFFFQAEDGIRDWSVTGVQTCALPISPPEAGRDQARVRWRRAWSDRAIRSTVTTRRIWRSRSPSGWACRRGRSEERRVGKEGRPRRAARQEKKATAKEIAVYRVGEAPR